MQPEIAGRNAGGRLKRPIKASDILKTAFKSDFCDAFCRFKKHFLALLNADKIDELAEIDGGGAVEALRAVFRVIAGFLGEILQGDIIVIVFDAVNQNLVDKRIVVNHARGLERGGVQLVADLIKRRLRLEQRRPFMIHKIVERAFYCFCSYDGGGAYFLGNRHTERGHKILGEDKNAAFGLEPG